MDNLDIENIELGLLLAGLKGPKTRKVVKTD
jgi:hypothetical protein